MSEQSPHHESYSPTEKTPEKRGLLGRALNWFKEKAEAAKNGILAAINSISGGVRESIAAALMLGATEVVAHAAEPQHHEEPAAIHAEHGPESKEVPEVKEVKERCREEDGYYIGLSKIQREVAHVEVGDVVELLDEHQKSLGFFMVGKGKLKDEHDKDFTKDVGAITANVIPLGTKVKVQKVEKDKKIETSLAIMQSVEKVPTDLHGDEKTKYEKHLAHRKEVIPKRFPGESPECYITVPSSIGLLLGLKPSDPKTLLEIGKIKMQIGHNEPIEVVAVPCRTEFGYTTEAREKYHLSDHNKLQPIEVHNGILKVFA